MERYTRKETVLICNYIYTTVNIAILCHCWTWNNTHTADKARVHRNMSSTALCLHVDLSSAAISHEILSFCFMDDFYSYNSFKSWSQHCNCRLPRSLIAKIAAGIAVTRLGYWRPGIWMVGKRVNYHNFIFSQTNSIVVRYDVTLYLQFIW